ncbi:hypothetical protein Tco_1050031 [Tanacetum coccineum]
MNTSVLLLYLIERRDEIKKIRLDHLKQDQEMLVINIFSKRKKVFRERKKCEKIHAKRIVLLVEDKLDYLEQPIPLAPVPAQARQQVVPEALAAHAAWVKGSKEIVGLMLMTMEPDI